MHRNPSQTSAFNIASILYYIDDDKNLFRTTLMITFHMFEISVQVPDRIPII